MNIKELAEQAGAKFEHLHWLNRDLAPLFERFADLVAAHEREECAKVAEDKNTYFQTDCGIDVATDIADAIRARSAND